jgi:hypothetical protein
MKPDRSLVFLAVGWTFFLVVLLVSVALVRCARLEPPEPRRPIAVREISR